MEEDGKLFLQPAWLNERERRRTAWTDLVPLAETTDWLWWLSISQPRTCREANIEDVGNLSPAYSPQDQIYILSVYSHRTRVKETIQNLTWCWSELMFVQEKQTTWRRGDLILKVLTCCKHKNKPTSLLFFSHCDSVGGSRHPRVRNIFCNKQRLKVLICFLLSYQQQEKRERERE